MMSKHEIVSLKNICSCTWPLNHYLLFSLLSGTMHAVTFHAVDTQMKLMRNHTQYDCLVL